MRRLVRAVVAGALLVATAQATVIRPMTLEEIVERASDVFVGTVREQRAVSGGPPGNLIFTEVTFDELTVLKGDAAAARVTYRFGGGVLDGRRCVVVGVPRFVDGRRYVLLANAKLDPLCPAIGWWQGRYRVLRDVDSGEEILADCRGRAVYGFADGMPVTRPPDEDARPWTLATFLERVRAIVREQAEDRAGEGGAAAEPRGDASGAAAEDRGGEGRSAEEPREGASGAASDGSPEADRAGGGR